MRRKFISLSIVTCVICGLFFKTSYALSEDEFLKFLINTSYPETKVETPKSESEKEVKNDKIKEESSKQDKKENKIEKNTTSKDDEFVKMYVGKENIPKSEGSSKDEKTSEVASTSSKYVDNVLVTRDQPKILIYHTHGGETYVNSPNGNYHSYDKANSTMEIGALLTQELNKKGRSVVHNTTYHDIPEFTGAYSRSLKTIEAMQSKYNSVDVIIDLHRDGRDIANEKAKKDFHDSCTTKVNGENVAKFLFVVGEKSENYSKNLQLAKEITAFAESKYPGITRPVVKKPKAKFNQYKSDNPLLLEVGGNANTIEESKASVKYISEVIDEFFKQKGM
ncbi:stage II sporulation protein P [Paraclostridium ghonii]|uniref:stage II sporulation protein P n=1 Tax=Paraclostridium ghonii TaxID=29358 RepID=UPI00202CDEE6|nr:stage II sporulation protein P [Paeniclostridium ghonii]MCM0166355.1 stage II sporulation protein P [Paeniclostridium ghonii]